MKKGLKIRSWAIWSAYENGRWLASAVAFAKKISDQNKSIANVLYAPTEPTQWQAIKSRRRKVYGAAALATSWILAAAGEKCVMHGGWLASADGYHHDKKHRVATHSRPSWCRLYFNSQYRMSLLFSFRFFSFSFPQVDFFFTGVFVFSRDFCACQTGSRFVCQVRDFERISRDTLDQCHIRG